MGRARPRTGTSIQQRVVAAQREHRAAELAVAGWTLAEIAADMGMSTSGVHEALNRYRVRFPAQALEHYRAMCIERLERVHRLSMGDVEDEDADVRDKAQRRVIRAVEALARVTGILQEPAIQVLAPMHVDLSGLTMEEIAQLRAIRMKLATSPPALGPAVEAQGHEVVEGNDDERSDERGGEDGATGGVGDRP